MPYILRTFNNSFQNPKQSLKPLNDSHIVIIQKKEGATELSDYRSISLHAEMFLQISGKQASTALDFTSTGRIHEK
jgi:hypothetical protein